MTGDTVTKFNWADFFKNLGVLLTAVITVSGLVLNYRRNGQNARPILQLVKVEIIQSQRKAVFTNDGGAQAHDLSFRTASGSELNAPNRALGKGVRIEIPVDPGDGVIDVSFTSTYNEKGQSIFAYSELGNIAGGDQAYGSEIIAQAQAAAIYNMLLRKVRAADAKALLASAGKTIASMKSKD